ncbi:S-methyl-5-thioribose-1-phosphate isomerase [Enterococcus termitis]|nr:S-methyl-5-thioribose-1-phosphate isomerase [Enterococcus termitis]
MLQVESVRYVKEENQIILLDQTLLPTQEEYITISTVEALWEAIVKLQVRGAPAIGIAAAYGAAMSAQTFDVTTYDDFKEEYQAISTYLASSRPTAVNLFWALNRMEQVVKENPQRNVNELKELLIQEANLIKIEDAQMCKQIGEHALTLLEDGQTVLTHCNAGAIATAQYGTALSPIYLAKERGMTLRVYADETRPLLQGARLTTWELMKAGIDVTLITDNMAAMVMQQGKIDAVIVGCDRIAANGDAANKIGTYGVAVLAEKHGIPFYVAGPTSTIDMETKTGLDIPIEERGAAEITNGFGKQTAPDNVKVYNPAFDVTPHELITAIITEKGVIERPNEVKMQAMFGE